jgi:hypothetical protein
MFLRPRPVATVARTAVVAGTATAVSNRVSRRQANKWESQQEQQATQMQAAQPAAPPAAPSAESASSSDVEQLRQFAKLHDQGILTDEEFAAKKQQILGI